MSHQTLQPPDLIAGPPPETSLAQPLLTEPKPLRIIYEELDGRGPFVTKNKQSPREGICLQERTYPRQAVDPATEVHRFHRQPDLHLRCDLNHLSCPQKTRLSSTGSNSLGTPFNNILILAPLGDSISTRHSERAIGDPRSSLTKPSSAGPPRDEPLPRVTFGTRFFKPLKLSRNARDTSQMECSWHRSTAACHRGSGIGPRHRLLLRQVSN